MTMTTSYVENAIEKAVEGGYSFPAHSEGTEVPFHVRPTESDLFLDPLFWQSLGKSLGWDFQEVDGVSGLGKGYSYRRNTPHRKHWKVQWHRFIDHLAEGHDAESFFESLINVKG